MAAEKEETEDKKKPGDGAPPPTSETILAKPTKDAGEAANAEHSIRGYLTERLAEWNEQMQDAIDTLDTWIASQTQEAQAGFDQRGYFDALGDRFLGELYDVAGGRGTPIMDALAGEANNTVSFAQHSEFEAHYFLVQLQRSVRDACWYVRDAAPSVLSNQWPELLDLAYQGSTEFVPALHALGLPLRNFKPAELSGRLVEHAQAWRDARQPAKEQATELAQDEQKKQEVEQEAQQLMQDEGERRQLQA